MTSSLFSKFAVALALPTWQYSFLLCLLLLYHLLRARVLFSCGPSALAVGKTPTLAGSAYESHPWPAPAAAWCTKTLLSISPSSQVHPSVLPSFHPSNHAHPSFYRPTLPLQRCLPPRDDLPERPLPLRHSAAALLPVLPALLHLLQDVHRGDWCVCAWVGGWLAAMQCDAQHCTADMRVAALLRRAVVLNIPTVAAVTSTVTKDHYSGPVLLACLLNFLLQLPVGASHSS